VGIELALMWIGISIAGAFAVDKSVDLYKHSKTVGADKYESCLRYTKKAKACRGLE
jgi:hypothetical protein